MFTSGGATGYRAVEKPDAWLYLEEITHRILNDYTAMLAIVRCAAQASSHEASRAALIEVAAKLHAAALSFITLRPPSDGLLRDLSGELEPLCASLTNSILQGRQISLTLSSESISISAYRCWQLSLVVSELVTNASKHAFRSRNHGSIKVTTALREGAIECSVMDDGACETIAHAGRGTVIIDALVADLGGTVSRGHSPIGSTVTVSIPIAEAFFVPAVRRTTNTLSTHPSSISEPGPDQ